MDMVYEVRRQFKEIPGIMEGTGKPEYGKCVEISTKAALREMMLPGVLTIGFPIAIVLLGKLVYSENNQLIAEMLGGYMAGVTVSGVLWAIFQNNAGGAWDNAKKSFEAGVLINGEMTFKGSDAHKAAVTGDTVGDPFKDTSGPSMNILIKLTCLIGLVMAPILGGGHSGESEKSACCAKTEMCDGKKMKCDMSEMATMTKTECEKMCDELGCSPSDKALCLSHYDENGKFIGSDNMKCDLSKCASMSKEECAKMCDEMGCSADEKAMCLSHYDENGKFIGGDCKMKCCAEKGEEKKEIMKRVSIEKEINNGKSKATIITTTLENGKETKKAETFEGTETEVNAKIEAFKKK
jgi:K(+)-stimulated pyrophosphate-energized sodium pump